MRLVAASGIFISVLLKSGGILLPLGILRPIAMAIILFNLIEILKFEYTKLFLFIPI